MHDSLRINLQQPTLEPGITWLLLSKAQSSNSIGSVMILQEQLMVSFSTTQMNDNADAMSQEE